MDGGKQTIKTKNTIIASELRLQSQHFEPTIQFTIPWSLIWFSLGSTPLGSNAMGTRPLARGSPHRPLARGNLQPGLRPLSCPSCP